MDRKLVLRILSLITPVLLTTLAVRAQTDSPSPLDMTTPDPMLPTIDRPLSPLERFRLEQLVIDLDKEATELLQAGNDEAAFTIWYRELRLQRELGQIQEIEALTRVGKIALDQNRPLDVNIITQRLETIELEARTAATISPTLLTTLGEAYQQVGNLDKALEIQQEILDNARKEQDTEAITTALENIGKLYLAYFDYNQAAPIYEELLTIARSQSDTFAQTRYLKQLAEIYTEALQPENSITIKSQIALNYQQNQELDKLPPLLISLGKDYETLNQTEKASQAYQQAFELAWSQRQLATASEALQQLGSLYRSYDLNQYALEVYQQLLKVEQEASNYYGLMNAYDYIGQIHLELEEYNQALAAFESGLAIAQSLSYQQDYFQSQIEFVSQLMLNY